MSRWRLLPVAAPLILLASCIQKPTAPVESEQVTPSKVVHDLAAYVANPNYADIEAKAALLQETLETELIP
jgi:hypothetical protein